jgi:hypothetical protein
VLREWQSDAASLAAGATPVLIAPYLSLEAQDLCKQSHVGFLDFEGNARLTVGDSFIFMRSLPRAAETRASAALHKMPTRGAIDPIFPSGSPKFSRKQAPAALSA